MNLSGSEYQKVLEAIISAYPSTTALKMMVLFNLDQKLDEIAGGENVREVVFNLMEWAKSQGKLKQLLEGAQKYNPGNQELKDIYNKLFTNSSNYGQQQQDLGTNNVTTVIESKSSPQIPIFEFDIVMVNAQGLEIKREKRQAQYYTENLGNNITLEMVDIPGGKFMMGSPEGQGDDNEYPQHEVTIQRFFMGKYPITQAQWRVVAALPQVNRELKPGPSYFKGDDYPVERVSWYDVVEFCARLSKKTGKDYRLPSEAEWEYACRSGTTTPFHFGETLTDKLANYRASETSFAKEPKGEFRQKTTVVGTFSPNAFGLYDMHGNVWEWCEDSWHKNYQGAPTDGSCWPNNRVINNRVINNINIFKYYVLRGGSWGNLPGNCRSAFRLSLVAGVGDLNGGNGFRVACSAAWTQ